MQDDSLSGTVWGGDGFGGKTAREAIQRTQRTGKADHAARAPKRWDCCLLGGFHGREFSRVDASAGVTPVLWHPGRGQGVPEWLHPSCSAAQHAGRPLLATWTHR